MSEVIIDGVRYVPDPQHADRMSIYYMHDNHCFTKLKGTTLDEILAHADEIKDGEWGSYGALCPVHLLSGNREVRRVGDMVHAGSSKDSKGKWEEGKAKWRKQVEADPDVMRLLNTNGETK